MKSRKHSITFGIALVCAMLFNTCDNFVEPPEIQTSIEIGYGKISISFAGEEATQQQARTVLPSTVFYKYAYTFIKAGTETGMVKVPDNNGFFTLEIGSYTVEVQAFTGNAEPYTLAATGKSSEFSVGPGSNDSVEIVLTGVGTDTQGEFRYTITYPAGAVAEITLQKWPGLDGITLNPVNITQGNGKTQTLQLETGSYLLTVLISKTGLYAGINEAVHIYPSLSTVYTKNYVNNDFLPKIPGAAVSAPTLSGATQNSITINLVAPPSTGQSVEYGINTTNTAPSTWQTGLTFSGLSGGVYYLFARSAENDDYTAGTTNASLQVIIVTTTTQWSTALTTISGGGSGTVGNLKTYTIMVFGNVSVSGSTSTGFGSVQYIEVTLKGSGTLSLSSSGSILRLGNNQKLIIDDENLTLQGRSGNSYAVMYVASSGMLELKGGVIRGNTSNASGGGVYVGEGGAFTMSGGEISGNTAATYNGTSYSGGGVLVYGDFTMSGGIISGNTASYRGGGVAVGGSFTMTGGIVYGSNAGSRLANTASGTANGAALYVVSGTAKYGDDTNILPHTDNQSLYTNNTIIPGIGGGAPVTDYTVSGTGTFTYDGSAKTVTVTPNENASPGAITVLYNGAGTLPVNVGEYTVTFNVATAPGFDAKTGLRAGTVTITKADGAAVSAPTGTSSVNTTSIIINAVTAPSNGQTVEYAINTLNSAPSSGWQTGRTFSGLTADTTYYFFARSVQNTNYNAGTASAGYLVTTPKPNYSISLNPSGTHTFTAATYGYGAQSSQSVTVNNTGINATGTLTVALSGTNASNYFTLSTTSINSIAAGGTASFTIRPNTGLSAGTYTATVTVSGSNSISASLSVSFTVNRTAGAAVNAPSGPSSITGTSITINAVNAPANGQTVEYAMNTSNSAPSSGWQTDRTFSGLTAGTFYYFFARSAQNTNYDAGTASSGYQVTPIIPLTENIWADGNFASVALYSFSVTNGTIYHVWWNDSKQGNGTKTLDVRVSAAYSNGTSIFTNIDSGYENSQSFTATTSGTVQITVTPYTSGNTGTFAVAYSTSAPITPDRITTTSEWNQALTAVRNAGNGTAAAPKNHIFNIGGDFTVPGLVTNNASTGFGTVTDIVVTLKGNGTISLSSTGRIAYINSGQRLVIDSGNLTLKGITGNTDGVLIVQNGGNLELKNGKIIGNANVGVNVVSGGTFTMSGGEISGNSYRGVYNLGSFTLSGGKINNNTCDGVDAGGGVYSSGSFTMSGGEISGNRVSRSSISGASGGGVYVSSGGFTMSGGEISNNTSNGNGGGVYVSGGFNMSGTAKINGNTASGSTFAMYGGGVYVSGGIIMSSGEISNNTSNIGGGVYVNSGNFNMSGTAKINNNTVNSSTSGYSGGVYFDSSGTFTMSGGEITGNKNNSTSANASGGVYISSGTFSMSGGSVTGNTNAYNTSSSADIFIASTFNLSGGSNIGSLTLYATSTTTQYPITLNGAFTGSVTQLNLSGNNSTITTVINYWVGKAVLRGGSSYTLTTTDVTKFNNVLGEFRYSGGTTRQAIKSGNPACKIGEYSPDVGNLIYN